MAAGEIDGLELEFSDLSPAGQLKAVFRKQQAILTPEQRTAIEHALTRATDLSNRNQTLLRQLITNPTEPTNDQPTAEQ